VRKQHEGEVGFPRRRAADERGADSARRGLVVVGDSATLSGAGFYQRMVEHFEGWGRINAVWEEP